MQGNHTKAYGDFSEEAAPAVPSVGSARSETAPDLDKPPLHWRSRNKGARTSTAFGYRVGITRPSPTGKG